MAKTEEPKELLNALESIKGLLEQSEIKLSAAKESIELATPPPLNPLPLAEVEEIEGSDVPVDIPELDEIVVPAATADAKPTVDMEVLKAFLDEMQKNIEKTMRDKLMKAVVAAENDVKKQLRAYLDQLRKMMDN